MWFPSGLQLKICYYSSCTLELTFDSALLCIWCLQDLFHFADMLKSLQQVSDCRLHPDLWEGQDLCALLFGPSSQLIGIIKRENFPRIPISVSFIELEGWGFQLLCVHGESRGYLNSKNLDEKNFVGWPTKQGTTSNAMQRLCLWSESQEPTVWRNR